MPIRIYLEKTVLAALAKRGIHEAIKIGTRRIRRSLRRRNKKGPERTVGKTPIQEKLEWTEGILEKIIDLEQRRFKSLIPGKIRNWSKEKWKEEWTNFIETTQQSQQPLIHSDLFGRTILHKGLKKAESSMAIQKRTGKIGLAEFLYKRQVLGIETASCPCGWRKQDIKHILMFCQDYNGRELMLQKAGSIDIRNILTTERGLKAATQWMIQSRVLGQFSLAREQLY